jgi:hypothetical protein
MSFRPAVRLRERPSFRNPSDARVGGCLHRLRRMIKHEAQEISDVTPV